jgi:hypothetical protein
VILMVKNINHFNELEKIKGISGVFEVRLEE